MRRRMRSPIGRRGFASRAVPGVCQAVGGDQCGLSASQLRIESDAMLHDQLRPKESPHAIPRAAQADHAGGDTDFAAPGASAERETGRVGAGAGGLGRPAVFGPGRLVDGRHARADDSRSRLQAAVAFITIAFAARSMVTVSPVGLNSMATTCLYFNCASLR